MEQLFSTLWGALPGIASTAVITACALAWRTVKGWHSEHTSLVQHVEESEGLQEMQKAQNAALREILGDMLDKEHARLVAQGYASPAEKLAFERKYRAYHALGGNGTRTALYEDVMKMNSYPQTGKEKP